MFIYKPRLNGFGKKIIDDVDSKNRATSIFQYQGMCFLTQTNLTRSRHIRELDARPPWCNLGPVVQRVDNAIHRKNRYPVD